MMKQNSLKKMSKRKHVRCIWLALWSSWQRHFPKIEVLPVRLTRDHIGRVLSDGWSALPWRQTQRFLHAVPHSVVMVTVHWHVHHKLSADCCPHQRPFWIGDCLIFWRENSVRFRHLFGIFRIPGCQSDKFPRRNLSVKRHSIATADKKKYFFFFFYKNEKCWKLNGNLLT